MDTFVCLIQLLRFIKKKLKDHGDEVVCLDKNKKEMTLNQVFEEMNLTAYELTVDMLDVHAVRTDDICHVRIVLLYF